VVEGFLQWVLNKSWEAGKIVLECDLEINKSWQATNNLRLAALEIRLNFLHV
jgi:hypothetical protein